jgi:pre-mRNA-splicing factor CWC22
MKAQAASPPFTPVYAAMIAIINTKFPIIGELLLTRLLSQFRRSYKRSDKSVCLSSSKFIAHLVNQKIVNEIVALQILTLLLETPTDDSVEVAVGFMREVGAFLMEESSKASNAVFERFRAILHEGQIDIRTQYMVEVLYQVRKDKFVEHASVPEGLDIVEEDDQITHMIGLTDELVNQDLLNVFQKDANFLENEQKYEEMKREILGDSDEDDEEEEEDGSGGDESEEDEEEVEKQRKMRIIDKTSTNLVNLRRGIYLTIMSSVNFEECAHKLMKIDIGEGQELELCNMIIECCSQEKTYVTFYGLLGERFCNMNENWSRSFSEAFEETYKTIHRFETNRLRNIAKFFSHLLATNALTWEVFALITLTEQDTTSSSRIFCKILFTSLVESISLAKLNERLHDKSMLVRVNTAAGTITRNVFDGLFPKDNPRNTRFAINYFTSIGLGALTEDLREFLKNAPKVVERSSSSSSSGSSSDSSSSSGSSGSGSDSDSSSSSGENQQRNEDSRRRSNARNPSPVRRVNRRESPGRPSHHDKSGNRKASRSPPRRRVNRSATPPHIRRNERSNSPTRRQSPVRRRSPISPRRRETDRSRSRSPRHKRERSETPPRESRRNRTSHSQNKRDRSRSVPRKDSDLDQSTSFVHPDRLARVSGR